MGEGNNRYGRGLLGVTSSYSSYGTAFALWAYAAPTGVCNWFLQLKLLYPGLQILGMVQQLATCDFVDS